MPAKERISGLCRVVFISGESKGLENSPKNRITRLSVGITWESALCSRSLFVRGTSGDS
jgi:hypothetical protein